MKLIVVKTSKYHVKAMWYPRAGPNDIIQRIFGKVHHLASHSTTSHKLRWASVERNLLNRFRKLI